MTDPVAINVLDTVKALIADAEQADKRLRKSSAIRVLLRRMCALLVALTQEVAQSRATIAAHESAQHRIILP